MTPEPTPFAPSRRRAWHRWPRLGAGLLAAAVLAGCAAGAGISIPIGRVGSIGVGVDSDGRVSGGVAVGRGGVTVGVGGAAQLPQTPASAASASGR